MKLRILYINNYSQGTGWSVAGQNYILALDSVGADVIPRRIFFGDGNLPIPERLTELENKSSRACDFVVYHTLPHLIQYDGRFRKNICLLATETSNFIDSGWAENLNLMERIIVPSEYCKKACENSGVNVKIKVVPHAFDPSRYQKSYGTLRLPVPENHYIFYYIGEFSRRKNLGALIKAFHAEFEPWEPVELLLKVNKPGSTPQSLDQELGQYCRDVRAGLKKFRDVNQYKPELLVTGYLTDEEIMQLHETCHCFVSTSHGEAFCIPAYEAMAMGRDVIGGQMGDFLNQDTGYLIETYKEPCFGAFDTFQNLYTYNEDWQEYPINQLRKAMRDSFSNRTEKNNRVSNKINKSKVKRIINDFSYETIGKLLENSIKW